MSEELIGKEILGQFRVLEQIGRGGMGEVYKAEQPSMDRMVAIKILHKKLTSRKDIASRFRREARAMSRLRMSPGAGMEKAWRKEAELPPESKGVITCTELCVYSIIAWESSRRAVPPLKKRILGPSAG